MLMTRLRALALGTVAMGTVAVAERVGIFQKMDGRGPMTAEEVAAAADLPVTFTREALAQLAATGVLVHTAPDHFELEEEAAMCLARPDAPTYAGGLGYALPAIVGRVPDIAAAVREGKGLAADQYPADLVTGFDLLSSPGIRHLLAPVWLPQIGMAERLEDGARVLDVGCGAGGAALAVAAAYPKSHVTAFDVDPRAVERAKEHAPPNATFEVGDACDFSYDEPFDLVMTLGVLHNLPRPGDALACMRRALKDDGVAFVMHPDAADDTEGNFDARGALLLGLGVLYSVPVAMSHGADEGGACVGPAALERHALAAGFATPTRLSIEHPLSAFYVLDPEG